MNPPTESKLIPPYAALAAELRRRIVADALSAGDYIGTELQIAKESRRSRMTVRRSVQMLINEGLVERRPGRGIFVRAQGHETRHIHMLAGNLLWTPAVRVSRAVQERAQEAGIDVTLRDACGSIEEDVASIRELPTQEIDGAIIMSQHCASFNRALAFLVASEFPFVVVDQGLRDIEAPSVVSDNRDGGAQAVRHLAKFGHTRIAFIGDIEASTSEERYIGVRDGCAELGLPLPAVYDIQCNDRFADWEPNIRKSTLALLSTSPRPTAIVCSCDAVARHVYRVLADQGLTVPSDMSIIGFDDDPIAEWVSPSLTTIRQDFTSMGHAAMMLLEQRIANANTPTRHIRIPVTLVERESVAAPPAS